MENYSNLTLLAKLSIITAIISLLCLVALHFTSPEFKPGWRMISEYALGKHKWLLTAFFFTWSLSSLFLGILLWKNVTSGWALFAVILLILSAMGEFMGGAFDVKHKLHGMAFGLGIPTLPIAAVILSYHLIHNSAWHGNNSYLLLSAHSTWISLVIMGISMFLIMSGFKNAGVPMGPGMDPPEVVPQGVIAINGYANRLLVACYIFWLIMAAKGFKS